MGLLAGLKNETVKLKDMRLGGYTPKDVKTANFTCKEVSLSLTPPTHAYTRTRVHRESHV